MPKSFDILIQVYLSLLPIVAGVVIASATELSFSFVGMFSALFSTFVYSLLNILVKKVGIVLNLKLARNYALYHVVSAVERVEYTSNSISRDE